MNDKAENLVVLGCGYVGCAVARSWLARGGRVWAVSRNAETLASVVDPRFHTIVAEVDGEEWHSRVPAEDVVILNCVAAAGGGVEGYRKSYLGGNRSLVRWARGARPGRIVYTGSTAVYPFSDGREVFEDDAGGDLSETGEIVLESERILFGDEANAGRTTVLRLAGIYGPGRHYLLDGLREGKRVFPGRGDVYVNLVHRDDIVGGIEAVLANSATGGRAYNLSDGHPVRKEEMVRWLAERLGLPAPTFDPEAPGRRMRINFSGAPPNRRVRIDRIREETGWRPRFADFRRGFEAILGGETRRGNETS